MRNLGFFRKRSVREKGMAMARLAAVETLGMVGRQVQLTAGSDRDKAVNRLKGILGGGIAELDDEEAKGFLDAMLAQLQNSAVNINFKASDFFASTPSDKYSTKFEVMRKSGAPMGSTRNEAEEKMFHYSGKKAASTASAGEKAAVERMNKLGKLESAEFHGVVRPRYCSLNFPALMDGFGAQWGRSHFVLANHLKLNMSFVHSDSFDITGSGRATPDSVQAQVATYSDMTRLVCNMPDVMLNMLGDAVSGFLRPNQTWALTKSTYGFGSTMYIEAQCHAEIYFNRDVAEMRICTPEIGGDAKIQKCINEFVAKNRLQVSYFD